MRASSCFEGSSSGATARSALSAASGSKGRAILYAYRMETADIAPGMTVLVTDAEGHEHRVKALSEIESDGHSFPIVWVARPLEAGGTDRVPWPLEAVRPA